MFRTGPALVALLLTAAPAAAAERSYSVTDFERVQVDGPYEVVLVTGRPSAARASGSAEAIDRVTVEVQGRTLRIRTNRSAWGGNPDRSPGPVRIEASTRDLSTAAVIGSGSLRIDRVRGLRVDLSVSGSGQLEAGRVDADNLVLGLLGSGRIAAAGEAKQLRATIQGSGDLDAAGLRIEDLRLTADTAGTISLTATRTANVTATGSGDVTVAGSATCTVEIKGLGRVACGR